MFQFEHLSESKRKHLTYSRKDLTNVLTFYVISYITFAASLFANGQYV